MGFYPKHLKVRRQRWNERIIATAGISGAMFQHVITEYGGDYIDRIPPSGYGWRVSNDSMGMGSKVFKSKSTAAAHYLVWWFYIDKPGMWQTKRWRA
jgi:hypothetical protein